MGIYNCASTLAEALDSLYAQTYQDFIIILCDDGSTDNTYAVAEQYATKHDNIILIKNESNQKLAKTLNHCLEYADTEYVARMDGDDISMPTRFEKELRFLDEHDEFDFVSCPMLYFDENGVWRRGTAVKIPTKENFRHGSAPFCHAPCMIRTEALVSIGGYRTTEDVERMEDYDLWARLMMKGYRGYNLQEHLYSMRNDKNAFSRRKVKDRLRSFMTSSKIKKELGLSHPYLSGIPDLLKALVPNVVVRKLKKRKYDQ
jgi:glycosyltransferase EpsE